MPSLRSPLSWLSSINPILTLLPKKLLIQINAASQTALKAQDIL